MAIHVMTNRTAAPQSDLQILLRTRYRDAFECWAIQVGRLHHYDRCGAEAGRSQTEAMVVAEIAENAYRAARDRLADNMLEQQSTPFN